MLHNSTADKIIEIIRLTVDFISALIHMFFFRLVLGGTAQSAILENKCC